MSFIRTAPPEATVGVRALLEALLCDAHAFLALPPGTLPAERGKKEETSPERRPACLGHRVPSSRSQCSCSAALLSPQSDPQCVLKRGVDAKQVFYVLNPDANLGDTEERLKGIFSK